MRVLCGVALTLGLGLAVAGCGPRKSFDGPTVDAFTGRVTHLGKPVTVPENEKVSLTLFHEKAQSFIIPVQPDGSFQIGWMPIGKYSVLLNRESTKDRAPPRKSSVHGGLTIEAGKTDYTIELGKAWQP
jgi:hypothetical protein